MPTQHKTIPDYLAALTPDRRATVDALRSLAAGAGDGITEQVKWNAPSFAQDGEDRITLGQDKSGKIRVILHRGVKAKDSTDFSFDASANLVQWAAPDRGVMTFASAAEVTARTTEIGGIFRRWLDV